MAFGRDPNITLESEINLKKNRLSSYSYLARIKLPVEVRMKRKTFVLLGSGACLLLGVSVFAFQPGGGYRLLRKVALSAAPGGSEYFDYITFDALGRRIFLSHGTEVKVLDADTDKVVGNVDRKSTR